MPLSAQLNAPERSFDNLSTFGLYPNGTKVTEKPEILFARLDLKEVMEKVEALQAANAPAPEPEKEEVYKSWMRAFADRKYNSDFAKEMTRSVREYLKEY